MHGSTQYDVAVVGGGPAGAAAALGLARGGARVVVLERHRFPRYKTCGGGVVGRARRFLPADVTPTLERHCHTAQLHFQDADLHFEVHRDEPIVSMGMRAQFDESLLEAARAAGAEVIAPCRVLRVDFKKGGVQLQTEKGSFLARHVVAADGAQSTIAKQAGWRRGIECIPALEYEVQCDDAALERFSATARFDFGVVPHGYAWVFPKRDHLSIGILSARRGAYRLHDLLDGYMRDLDLHVRSVEPHGALIPRQPRRGGFARRGVLLVGDAAGFVDPITFEGIGPALQSGQLAVEALLDRDPEGYYEAAIREQMLPELAWSRRLASILYGNPMRRTWLFHHFGSSLCEAMTDVITGRRSYRELLLNPANYFRLLLREPKPQARSSV